MLKFRDQNSILLFYKKYWNVKFKNLTIGLNILIIYPAFAKSQENQRSIIISLIKYLKFKFLGFKIM